MGEVVLKLKKQLKKALVQVEFMGYLELHYYGSTVRKLVTSKADLQNGLTLPTDPSTWSVEEVAQWVSQNGGTAAPVLEQDIDGRALMALATDDLFALLHIATVGKRVQFSQAMESLHAPPPSYVDN
ncbi:hypothetical protein HDU79_007068 [Rhizoclosmatium sp. JEL0117]|nr:hypothetical protein HDU79_007068 [Rhizoclosmatium sp. JEL0117]